MSRRKGTVKAKLNATSQEEWIDLWKHHFENLLGKPPKVTHEPITKHFSNQLDIKLGQFIQKELHLVLRKNKNRKARGLDEIHPEVLKTREFKDIFLRHCNVLYNKNTIERWTKRCTLPFTKKSDLRIAKDYWGITLTTIAAKINNFLLRKHIKPKLRRYLGRTKIVLGEIDPQHNKFWWSVEF